MTRQRDCDLRVQMSTRRQAVFFRRRHQPRRPPLAKLPPVLKRVGHTTTRRGARAPMIVWLAGFRGPTMVAQTTRAPIAGAGLPGLILSAVINWSLLAGAVSRASE
jgi:hypothetical protein